jgi:hypothetical protein
MGMKQSPVRKAKFAKDTDCQQSALLSHHGFIESINANALRGEHKGPTWRSLTQRSMPLY